MSGKRDDRSVNRRCEDLGTDHGSRLNHRGFRAHRRDGELGGLFRCGTLRARVDPSLDQIDLTRAQERAVHRHGGILLAGDHPYEQAVRGVAAQDRGAMVAALQELLIRVEFKISHLGALRVAGATPLEQQRVDFGGVVLGAGDRHGGQESEKETHSLSFYIIPAFARMRGCCRTVPTD